MLKCGFYKAITLYSRKAILRNGVSYMEKRHIRFMIIIAVLVISSFLAGCDNNSAEKSNIKSKPATANSLALEKVDWEKIINQTKSDILSQEKMVQDVSIKVDQSKKSIIISLACNNAINQSTAAEAADTAVRRLSSNAQMQNKDIVGPSKDNWGGVWDVYTLDMRVAKIMDAEKPSKWLIYDVVDPGVQGKHKFKGLNR